MHSDLKVGYLNFYHLKFQKLKMPQYDVQIYFCLFNPGRNLGQFVRNTINANLGLKDDQDFNFFCFKGFSIANVLLSLRLVHVETEGQKISTENLNEVL